ncbi:putative pre-mRNA splicing factor important for catalytic step II [Mycosarcoma maydis]|uniref:Pre-mRNA-processing factor 17 n=1 Tax=Mycosarcoma maydis TaxID=5270 RepID=A0A0D1CIA2_MYCMD|nr:putative pre-mRNA splicing factor important for catalytic step II [Ustilago maydis 521]KIS66688.1 putative pre-mRNA splicing factor important for catalytic step II [Ustilago maydis 521]|eukprot:XP_011391630.1 putative pre-mRNA splicing factor important for catalytic step II [Ustilago maydis 521]
MDALAGYGSDDSDAAEHSAPKIVHTRATTTTSETLDYDPSDAFGLESLKSQSSASSQTVHNRQADSSSSTGRASKKDRRGEATATAPVSSSTLTSSSSSHASVSASDAVTLAPKVIYNSSASEALLIRPGDSTMHVNIPYADMTAPQLGPENPFATRTAGAQQNTLTGHVESAAVSDFDFRNQQRTFHVYGYARDPSLLHSASGEGSLHYIGDQSAAARMGGASAAEIRAHSASFRPATKSVKKKRNGSAGDPGVLDGDGAYVGPWAKWQDDENVATQLLGGDASVGPTQSELSAAQAKSDAREREKAEAQVARKKAAEQAKESVMEKSIFHGKSLYDYQGRTYMHVPTDVDVNLSGEAGEQECFLPKSCIHTFRGHTKGISTLKLLPRSGHLLLSASLDTTVKLWDVYHDGQCLRTFMGHSKAVRDIAFSNDGRRFLSSGYDRHVKLWDTETGACLDSFSNGKTAYCLTFHPDADKQHIFLAGMSDKKVLQWDINTHTVTQEYTSHLGAVNTITFVDQNRRFVTTSDDKTMRGWDYDIPVVIKYIADPTMHSMPAVTLSPSGKWLAAQSMDNQILTFASDGFKQNRKKVFKGHNVAGFGCQVGFSPDGKFLSSGDGEGNVCFWDWKSTRLLKRLRGAHKEAVVSHAWLPHETSKVVTASWDGEIKLWD